MVVEAAAVIELPELGGREKLVRGKGGATGRDRGGGGGQPTRQRISEASLCRFAIGLTEPNASC